MTEEEHEKIVSCRNDKNTKERKRDCMQLQDIYNQYSGDFDNNCLCTVDLRRMFLTKFFKWYATH